MRRQNYGDKLNFAETLPDSSPDAAAAVRGGGGGVCLPIVEGDRGEAGGCGGGAAGAERGRRAGGPVEVAGERKKEVAEVTAGFAAADCGGRRREPPELEKKVAAGARVARVSKGAVAAAVGAPAPETTGSRPRCALTSS